VARPVHVCMNTIFRRRRTERSSSSPPRRVTVEAMEGRVLMSATPVDAVATEPQTSALLLPAVQKVRDAAANVQVTDGMSNTILFAESTAAAGDPRFFTGFVSRFSAG
jgi:hypothetical protein